MKPVYLIHCLSFTFVFTTIYPKHFTDLRLFEFLNNREKNKKGPILKKKTV